MPHVNQYKYDRDGNRVKRKKKRKRKRPPTADYLYKEHLNRLKHNKRRIKESHTLKERKKNKQDPLAHPVKFFRGGDQMHKINNMTSWKASKKIRKPLNLDYLFGKLHPTIGVA